MNHLPIEKVLPELREMLETTVNGVLIASPGAGKTTRVPLSLLEEGWLDGKRILVLEPRRLAARSAARYMAAILGEQVGETVGYRVRRDTQVGPSTRIEVITEGVLIRLLQSDPALEGVGIVIFDEFHERSLDADLGLALCLQTQKILRDDLRVLVMSATMEAEPVAKLLGNAGIIKSEGRSFPVETHYLPKLSQDSIEVEVVGKIKAALNQHHGSVLVFLPGEGEIRRVASKLAEQGLPTHAQIKPLYGSLPHYAQDEAIGLCPKGVRLVVLATSIAETSLTVEGIEVVIDSGLMRGPRFSPRTGMTRLETISVSRASADQRRGRAGRLGPGVCYRLWTEEQERLLPAERVPEIEVVDLAPLVLELAAWGISDPADLDWLTPPPAAAYEQAKDLLVSLGAVSKDGKITNHGKQMVDLGIHPRMAHMILKSIPMGLGALACKLAALLQERIVIREKDVDLRIQIEELKKVETHVQLNPTVDIAACKRIISEADHWIQRFHIAKEDDGSVKDCGLLLAFAYPDRIGMAKGGARFLLRNGRGAVIEGVSSLALENYIVAAEINDRGSDGKIFLAAPLRLEDLEGHFGEQIRTEVHIYWDRDAQMVRSRKQERLGALLLKDLAVPTASAPEVQAVLLEGIRHEGLSILPWSRQSCQLQQRTQFMQHVDSGSGWPDVSTENLIDTMEAWLGPYLHGLKGRDDLQKLNLHTILEAQLTWEQRVKMEEWAPTHLIVPSGSRISIDYSDPLTPNLKVKLQEMFGLIQTPRIANGQIPLTIHLLSPAGRPVQVTRDLENFWRSTYFEVKKDLKGRYPKHYWPDDPKQAVPTNRVRPKG